MPIDNREIIGRLDELATLIELDEGGPASFRARAYRNAVRALQELDVAIAELDEEELVAVKGVGKGIARTIREYVETGGMSRLEELRQTYPPGYVDLIRVPGLGPKTLSLLRRELGVETLDDLRAAVEARRLRDVKGLGTKSEEKIAQAIERLGLAGKEQRTPVYRAIPLAEQVVRLVRGMPEVERAEYAGSLRRFRETIADLDVVAASRTPGPVMDRFCSLGMVAEVAAHGETKSSIVTHQGLQVDLRVVRPEQFGAALLYFTGSKAHNIRLRQLAIERGWTLNEYGLFEADDGGLVASATEEEVYRALGLDYVPAPLREDAGEIEAAAAGELPDLVRVEHIRGDLHDHTDLSGDGRSTLEAMVEAAAARGYAYLAITDHGEDLRINGASREQLLEQRERLATLREAHPGLALLQGVELNIDPEGRIDYDEEFLAGFDWGVASVHSRFDLDPDVQTERVVAAMRNPAVNAIGHLTGRRIGRRAGIRLHVDRVLDAAAETGTALEINSHLDRLDAPPEVLRRAAERGVTFVISTDAHVTGELDNMRYGVLNARRGWVERDMVANTWEADRFFEWVRTKRNR